VPKILYIKSKRDTTSKEEKKYILFSSIKKIKQKYTKKNLNIIFYNLLEVKEAGIY